MVVSEQPSRNKKSGLANRSLPPVSLEGRLEAASLHIYGTPAHLEASSLHIYVTPAHLEGESLHFYGTPAHLEGESLHFYGTPAHLEGESLHFYGTPAHLEGESLHFYGTLAHVVSAWRGSKTVPGRRETKKVQFEQNFNLKMVVSEQPSRNQKWSLAKRFLQPVSLDR